MGLAQRDNLKTRNDFPAQRKRRGWLQLSPRGPTGRDHHRLFEKPVWNANRQGIEDDLQRGCVRHMAATLTVDKFGLDPEVFGFGEKVHSACRLHATVRAVAKFSRCRKRIAVFNSLVSPAFPRTPCPTTRFLYFPRPPPSPQSQCHLFSYPM